MKEDIEKIIKQLDNDHIFFLSFIKSLYIKEKYDKELTRDKLIDAGIDYIANHILREERVMRHLKYPLLDEHAVLHSLLQKTFLILIEEITLNNIPHENMISLLEETVVKHIQVEDAKFFEWLNK